MIITQLLKHYHFFNKIQIGSHPHLVPIKRFLEHAIRSRVDDATSMPASVRPAWIRSETATRLLCVDEAADPMRHIFELSVGILTGRKIGQGSALLNAGPRPVYCSCLAVIVARAGIHSFRGSSIPVPLPRQYSLAPTCEESVSFRRNGVPEQSNAKHCSKQHEVSLRHNEILRLAQDDMLIAR